MLRNREIRIFIIIMSVISVAATMIAAFFSGFFVIFTIILSISFISVSLLFSFWRYKKIEELSHYLRQVSSGDYSLDVRDNEEGELSILKNEIYKVTLKLSEQSNELEHDKLKLTEAIADISHQLKTPLTSMMMMADFLSDENLPLEKRKEFTGKIQVQLERIEWLVSSLLKLSRIDAGTARFKKEKISVKKVVQKALGPLLIPMEIKEIELNVKNDDNITFIGDENWTVEALLNIIKNCIEHTPNKGSITIDYSENPLYTEIVITDNGKGIKKEDLPYIFRRFYKGKNSSEGSIGIGLAMAHSIITNQNGSIDVKSEVGIGTQFMIKFFKQVI